MHDLSVCILTHKRPQLFNRLLTSVRRVLGPGVEVLVNNDSHDVTPDSRARYLYLTGPLNTLYQSLAERASGSHLWFLEDDDVVLKAPTLDPKRVTVHRYINHDNLVIDASLESPEFQLSQCCIPKFLLDFSIIEKQCNCIFNDWHLTHLLPHLSVASIIFRQFYAGDNISFPESPAWRGGSKCLSCQWLPEQMRNEFRTN